MLTQLVQYMVANAGLQKKIGARLSSDVAPESEKPPYVVYQLIDAPREHYLSGAFTGFNHPRIQFRCYGKNYPDAVDTASAVIAALEGFMGPMGSPAAWIYGILPENELDDEEGQRELRLYVRIVDCLILHA